MNEEGRRRRGNPKSKRGEKETKVEYRKEVIEEEERMLSHCTERLRDEMLAFRYPMPTPSGRTVTDSMPQRTMLLTKAWSSA